MKGTWLSAMILFLTISHCIAQNIINGSFEQKNNNRMPIHWQFFNNENFNFSLDSIHHSSGKYSLNINGSAYKEASLENSGIAANIYSENSEKKANHISLNCKIRFNDVRDSTIDIFIENIASNKILRKFIQKTLPNKWHNISVSFDINYSENWYSFYYGIELSKSINVWIDDVHLKVNGQEIKDAECFNYTTSAKDIQWLNNNLFPLDTSKIQKSFSEKMKNNFWDNAKIVGIGEPTHGTHEAQLFKSDLFKYLVEQKGFTTIALEETEPVCNILNDVINSSLNIKDTLMKLPMYKIWQTQEVLSLLAWMRKFNQTHARKIKFIGIDMEDWKLILTRDLLRNYGKKYNPEIYKQTKKIDSTINILLNINQTNEKIVNVNVNKLNAQIDTLHKVIIDSKFQIDDNEQYHRLLSYATVCRQWLISRFISNSNFFRDSCIAKNVEDYLSLYPNEKILLWAHNSHIVNTKFTSQEKTMGAYLKEYFKDNYMSLCFTTAEGFYTAAEDETQQSWRKYSIQFPYQGTLENILQKANTDFYFLPLKTKLPHWLKIPIMQLDIPYIQSQEEPYKFLGNNNPINPLFDGIIFCKKTNATHLLY